MGDFQMECYLMVSSCLLIMDQVKVGWVPKTFYTSWVPSQEVHMHIKAWRDAFLALHRRIVWKPDLWRREWKARRFSCAMFLNRRFSFGHRHCTDCQPAKLINDWWKAVHFRLWGYKYAALWKNLLRVMRGHE